MCARKIVQRGFALPTILIASVVMLIVLLSAIQSGTGVRVALDNSYYQRLAKEAAQAGLTKARLCIATNGSITWSTASPLRPNTTCSGGAACTNSPSCFVLSDTKVRSTFSIGAPTTLGSGWFDTTSVSTVERLRASSSTVWSTYSSDARATIPPNVAPLAITAVRTKDNTTCIIASGNVRCNGGNGSYGLGTGDTPFYNTATATQIYGDLSGKTVGSMDVDDAHACALDTTGKAYCWGGASAAKALGNGTNNAQPTPKAVSTSGVLSGKTLTKIMTAGTDDIDLVSTIYAHTCAIDTNNDAYCWGDDHSPTAGGQLGRGGSYSDSNVPVAVTGGGKYKDIDGGSWHTCAVRTDGTLYCWGADDNDQIGNGDGVSSTATPTPVQASAADTAEFSAKTFNSIASGFAHNCAIASDNTMWCWGQNNNGALGDGTTTQSGYAKKIAPPGGQTGWSKVAGGTYYTCAITVAGKGYCWGAGGAWIGDGVANNNDRLLPSAIDTTGVLSGKTLDGIWCGTNTVFAHDTTGKYYAWGAPGYNLRGDGVTGGASQYSPVLSSNYNNLQPSTSFPLYF